LEDIERLEQKVNEAAKQGFPSPLLFEAQDVLEKLKERVFTVSCYYLTFMNNYWEKVSNNFT